MVETHKTILVSGGFDPVHVGHIRLFKKAAELGDKLIVLINNDNWLQAKKGFNFMNELDRMEIISALECVDEVILTKHKRNCTDLSVCDALGELKPDVFANGGDRLETNIPEYELCKSLGIQLVFNVGGGKIRSSSELIKLIADGPVPN